MAGYGETELQGLEQGDFGLRFSLNLSDSVSHLLPSRYGVHPNPSAVAAAHASGSWSGILVQAASPRVSDGDSGKCWLLVYHPSLALIESLPP